MNCCSLRSLQPGSGLFPGLTLDENTAGFVPSDKGRARADDCIHALHGAALNRGADMDIVALAAVLTFLAGIIAACFVVAAIIARIVNR